MRDAPGHIMRKKIKKVFDVGFNASIISEAPREDTPTERLKTWFLDGLPSKGKIEKRLKKIKIPS